MGLFYPFVILSFYIFNAYYICKNKKGEVITMINTEVTKHLADLSRLSFDDEQLKNVTAEMSAIIELMDKVCDFNNNINAYAPEKRDFNSLRSDKAENSFDRDDVIKNSKAVKNGCFVVPKVV